MKEKITHIRKDNQGRIVEVKTNQNNIYDIEVAKELIENNKIENAKIEFSSLSGLALINSIDNDKFLGFPEF